MDTEKCKVLLCAIETGSLTAAAEKLGYTPSGVSRIMAALEEEAGFPLLFRSRSGVTPTKDCGKLLPVFREMVHLDEQFRQISAEICRLETGVVSVGTSYSAYYHWLAKMIAEFRSAHPHIEVRLLEGSSSELCAAMEERRADFCIISRREGNYAWIPLVEDPLMAWVPADHPLARLPAFPLHAFETEPYIDTYPGQDTDNARVFARCRIRPNVQFTSSDSSATYSLVEAGLGVSLNNSLTAKNWSGRVKVMPLDPPQTVTIGIAVPNSTAMSPAAGKFIAFAKTNVPEPGRT
jgi:DNA-binding transcriptional LysR family regulator